MYAGESPCRLLHCVSMLGCLSDASVHAGLIPPADVHAAMPSTCPFVPSTGPRGRCPAVLPGSSSLLDPWYDCPPGWLHSCRWTPEWARCAHCWYMLSWVWARTSQAARPHSWASPSISAAAVCHCHAAAGGEVAQGG